MKKVYSDAERLSLMTQDRRYLHTIPEYGYDLFETRAYVKKQLKETAPDALIEMESGFKAVYRAKSPVKKAIAFRTDMDALMILEKNTHEYVSHREGYMHACGHDGHMANMLMFARVLAGRRDELDRDIVLVFQPAEESYGGARPMVDAGLFHDPEVEAIYGMHLMPYFPIGKVACIPGPEMAAVQTINVHFQGRAAHGATPHAGNDAVMAMAQFCMTLQAGMRRRIDAFQPAVLTIGHVTAGSVPNIIAETADLECTLRCYDEGVGEQIRELMRASIMSADAIWGTKGTMEIPVSYPPVINDPALTEQVKTILGDAWMPCDPMTIAEDFSEYQKEIPGVFVFAGCGDAEHTEPLHSSTFGFDEKALLTACALFEKIVFGEN